MMQPTENSEGPEVDTGPDLRQASVRAALCIEWLEQPGACVTCGDAAGPGPVGWRKPPDPGPLCDRCLFDRHPDFGLLLFMTHILREAGRTVRGVDDPALRQEAMNALLSVAQICDLATAKRWPERASDLMTTVRRSRRRSESS